MKSPSTSTVTDYGRILRRAWVTVLIGVVGGIAVGWLAQTMQAPDYRSAAIVVATAPGPPSVVSVYASDLSGRAQAETLRNLALTDQVLRRVLVTDGGADLGTGLTPADLIERITVVPVPNSAVLRIETTGPTAAAATRLASSMSSVMQQLVGELTDSKDGSPQSELTVIDSAEPAQKVAATSLTQALSLGGAIGFVVVAMGLIGVDALRDRVGDGRDALHTLRDVKRLGRA